VADDFGCHICGQCWWVDCPNDADYSIDATLKRHGETIFDGKVELCTGHAEQALASKGQLSLNWMAIEQARALSGAK
jgi:hypothetical protein